MEISAPVVASLEILAVACLVTTAASWLRSTHWWVRVWDFPRAQQAVLAAALAVALVGFASPSLVVYGLVVLLGLAAAYHVAVILPYTPLWRPQLSPSLAPAGSRSLSLLIVNVLMGNRHADRLLALIREADPDLVLAVETDEWWAARLGELADIYQYAVAYPLANTYGMILRSRLPLEAAEVRFLLHQEIPSIRAGVKLLSGEPVRLYAVHPEPPSPTEAETSLGRDAELVIVGREIAKATEPAIVAGDLNDVGWSRTSRLFRRLSQLLDPRVGRGLFCTFHAGWPLIRWPLDHVFVSADFQLRDIRRLPAFGSDHFPIFIALDYTPKAVAAHEPPEPDHADLVEARETVAEAKAAVAAASVGPAARQLLSRL